MMINEKVSVGILDNIPKYFVWKGVVRKITKIGLHHTFREGRTLYHIFSGLCDDLFVRLKFDTSNLSWILEEISE